MSPRALRITIRGNFEELSDAQRGDLRTQAAEHDVFQARFTVQGHLAYDVDTRLFFTYRFLREAETDADVARAVASAEAAASAALHLRGLRHQLRSSQVQDLSQAPLSKRQRRSSRGPITSPASTDNHHHRELL